MCFKSIDYLAFAVTIMVKARKLFKRTASYLVVFKYHGDFFHPLSQKCEFSDVSSAIKSPLKFLFSTNSIVNIAIFTTTSDVFSVPSHSARKGITHLKLSFNWV